MKLESDGYQLDAHSKHIVLDFMLCYWMPRCMNPRVAAETRLRIAWVFVGAGGGTWLMEIAGGQTTVREERPKEVTGHLLAQAPDLTFTQTPEAFFKTLHLWLDPMVGLLTGEIQVQGFEHMRVLNELFPDAPERLT